MLLPTLCSKSIEVKSTRRYQSTSSQLEIDLCLGRFPAWSIGHDPSKRFACCSYSHELAGTFARQFRSVISSDWYRRLFPSVRFSKDSETECVTTRGGGRFAVPAPSPPPWPWPTCCRGRSRRTGWRRPGRRCLRVSQGDSVAGGFRLATGPRADPGRPPGPGPATGDCPAPILGRGWAKLDATYWPVELLPELHEYEHEHPPGTPVFNEYLFGGFLIFYTPNLRVFVDDRCELFGDDWLKAYVASTDHHPEQIERWAEATGFDLALVRREGLRPLFVIGPRLEGRKAHRGSHHLSEKQEWLGGSGTDERLVFLDRSNATYSRYRLRWE